MTQGKLTGAAMKRLLQEAGIPVQKVVRKRNNGYFMADFFVPDMQTPVASSAQWANRIRRQFDQQVTIINTNDTVATWRPGQPTIYATVTFDLHESQ